MFTGLVQTSGEVLGLEEGLGGKTLRVRQPQLSLSLVVGESVAVNGACLTIIAADSEQFSFQVGPETIAKTNIGFLTSGDRVNLERALRVGDALGGHFVSGHIDCTGRILEKSPRGEWLTVWFAHPPEFSDLVVERGSIAVDGVSLTVVEARPGRFSVMLIPHTRDHTTLGPKVVGDIVNLEFDLIAKHVAKLVKGMRISSLVPPVSGS